MSSSKELQIRNSTADFLVFTKQNSEDSIEVRVQNENIWLTQKAMAKLFDVQVPAISKHLKNIFEEGELQENSVFSILETTAADGKNYDTKYYNLDAIISVGYRVNSVRATQFRQWATKVLRTFAIQGYVLDKKRLKNGYVFDEQYFDRLLEEIQEIRASERKKKKKITDIYAMAVDYSSDAVTTQAFFASVQNKLHFATHGNTAYLDYAARQARRKIPMTMQDWAQKLDVFLELNDEKILKHKGKITHEIAKAFAENEFEQYRVLQDKQYVSDFDKILNALNKETTTSYNT